MTKKEPMLYSFFNNLILFIFQVNSGFQGLEFSHPFLLINFTGNFTFNFSSTVICVETVVIIEQAKGALNKTRIHVRPLSRQSELFFHSNTVECYFSAKNALNIGSISTGW